ncbi:MAG TPA: hypothetical protein VLG76_07485 [Rhabdochlamydiaceae bacterium]|nr:hypothetical protein [Rhabdochlamydiaceae bacterium]
MSTSLFNNCILPGVIVETVYSLYTRNPAYGFGRAIGTSLLASGVGIIVGPTVGFYFSLTGAAIVFLKEIANRLEAIQIARIVDERANFVVEEIDESFAQQRIIQAARRALTPAAAPAA